MPLSGGTSGAHDDAMHQGNAKRDVVNGVAGLGATGYLLAKGSGIKLYRDGTDDIVFIEGESGNIAMYIHRIGVNDFFASLRSGGAYSTIQLANMKDVVNGIAALDAAGSLLLPGSKMYYTRDGSDDVHIYERTSNEEAYAFHRVGADDYTFYVKESNVWKRMQTESMKDAANGIAGLDAAVKLLWDQMPLPMLTVAQFQANAATGTAANPERINDGSLLGSSTCDIVGEYMQVLFPHPMFISEYRQYGESGTNGDGVWKIQIYHDGAWHDNTTGISTLAADEWSAWVPLTIPVYTQGLRLVATTLDTAFTSNFIQELEIRG